MTFTFNRLHVSTSLALLCLHTPAHALIIDVQSSASSSVSLAAGALPPSTTSQTDGPANAVSTAVATDSNNLWAEAHGDNSGTNFAWAGAQFYGAHNATFSASSQIRQSAIITNDSATAQNLSFAFNINGGNMGLGFSYGFDGPLVPDTDYLSSSYSADILVNGVSIWNSSATLLLNNSGRHLSTNGTTLITGYDPDWQAYYWQTFADTLTLGTLGAGDSLTLDYVLNTHVEGFTGEIGYAHNVSASIGDPYAHGSSPISTDTVTTSPAPEPETVALMAAGTAVLAFRRRKTNQAA